MASRYWVGGTDTWNATAGSKWSTTSGGAGGSAVPTTSDNVFFDANSGANTITISGTRLSLNLDCTGFTGTIAVGTGTLSVYRSATLVAAMSLTNTSGFGKLNLASNVTGQTLTTNGCSIACPIVFAGTGAYTLQDNLTSTEQITPSKGTVDFNAKTVTCEKFLASSINTRNIDISSCTIVITGLSTPFTNSTTNLTWSATGSTIKFENASSGTQTFSGGGLTYADIWYASSASGTMKISGANTFDDIKIDPSCSLELTAGTTTTATTWTISGTSGNLVTLTSSTAATHTVTKAGGGTVNVDYVDVSYSIASAASTFFAGANSIDSGNNTDWDFPVPTVTGPKWFTPNSLFNYIG